VTRFIEAHRDRLGVEPIWRTLQVAPATYYAARRRPRSARALRDGELEVEIARVHKDNFSVYGVRKVWRQLGREGIAVGRDRVARLMRELGIAGVAVSRMIVGWRVATSLRAELALDALEMAVWARQDAGLDGLVHHSDRGVQYLAIRYPSAWPPKAPSPRSGPRATVMTTLWRRRSMGCTRPS
jgi:putative transposase